MLNKLRLPDDIKTLSLKELNILADETRTRIVEVVNKNGGHLAASLGAVELTIALLYEFSPLEDIILYDVGHQAYSYKLLTDRADCFATLRKFGGISGFPSPCESVYDKFTAGHAGNALAATCGYARARKLTGAAHHIISVLGDGVLVNGLTAESLNNVADCGKNIIVINDNNFSISPSVGSLAKYLTNLDNYSIKDGIIEKGSPFAMYGIDYIGGIDGHNIEELILALKIAKSHDKSVIVHIRTVKGKGYGEAEKNPSKFHAVGNGKGMSFADTLGNALVDIAAKDDKIVAVTAAMGIGTGLSKFEKSYPNRYFDVGIAEGHAVTMAAAMARAGYKPYVAIYSTFLQRAYDQIINDVCLSSLPVTFCIDRSGIVGEDGETHHGLFDINYLLSIPNLTIASPVSLLELESVLQWSKDYKTPLAIRYPRGCCEFESSNDKRFPYWSYVRSVDSDNVIIATGAQMVKEAASAADTLHNQGIDVDVINARFNKPLDTALLDIIKHKRIFTIEDGQLIGGFASYIRDYYNGKQIYTKGICDTFVKHGDIPALLKYYSLNAAAIVDWIKGVVDEA